MKFPVVVEKKKDRYGDKVYDAFCPLFHDARTFSPCDEREDAIEEVQEIIQDEIDELLDERMPLPHLPKADELKKQYPNAKVFWVAVETDSEDEDEDYGEEPDEDEEDEADDTDNDEIEEDEYDEEIDDLLDEDDD